MLIDPLVCCGRGSGWTEWTAQMQVDIPDPLSRNIPKSP